MMHQDLRSALIKYIQDNNNLLSTGQFFKRSSPIIMYSFQSMSFFDNFNFLAMQNSQLFIVTEKTQEAAIT